MPSSSQAASFVAALVSGRRLLLVSAAALSSLSLSACSGEADAQSGPPPVPTVGVLPIVEKAVTPTEVLSGRLEAVKFVDIRPQVSGPIAKVAFTDGAVVQKGALLFQIDDRPFKADLARAEAVLASAKAQAALARAEAARVEQLLLSKAVSQAEADQARATLASREADILSAEAAVSIARLQLDYTAVRAPITGRVSRALLTEGNLVSPEVVLTSIASTDPIYAAFDLSETSLIPLRQSASRSLTAKVGLAQSATLPLQGPVVFVDNQLNPQTGAARMRVRLANPDGSLLPGMAVRVQLPIGKAKSSLLVPDRAVVTDQDRKLVFVIGADGQPQPIPVELGRLEGGLRAVEGPGLKVGQKVVVEGVQRIQPGAPVQARDLAGQ